MELKPPEHVTPESVTHGAIHQRNDEPWLAFRATQQTGRASITNSKWEESLATAILHLVGAYRAMEILSASAFPSGAPVAFELACHCLCNALLTLDA